VAFIKSFEAVYCFLPLMVKVLFIGQVRIFTFEVLQTATLTRAGN